MNRLLFGLTLAVMGAAGSTFAYGGEVGTTPVITLTTNLYQEDSSNYIVLQLGSVKAQTVAIEGGYGKTEVTVEPAVYDPEIQGIKSTTVAAQVTKEGVVRIYAEDASLIDYLDAEGCYIHTIDLSQLTNLEILSMNHNELEMLDLSPNSRLQSISLNDNPFNVSPLKIGGNKPDLTILSLNIVDNMSPDFTLTDYPALVSFSAWANRSLMSVDPTGCPQLRQLSIDGTDVSSLDLSKNPLLQILNITDTRIADIDLSVVPDLRQLYCHHQSGTINPDVKMTRLDVSHNPKLVYLYCAGNLLKELDLSANTSLLMLNCSHNLLPGLDLSNNPYLDEVNISYNRMDYATMPQDPGTWSDYIWIQQPMQVDLSYPEGATIDLSGRVIIPQAPTYARLMIQDRYDPDLVTEIEEDAYTYADGKLTLHKALPDSVHIEFYNEMFRDNTLNTTKFMVKTAAEYGKPTAVGSFTGPFESGRVDLRIGVSGASPETPKTVYFDFGDGVDVPVEITSSTLPLTPNVSGNASYSTKKILVPDGVYITALGINSQLYSIDVKDMTSLEDLDLNGAGLYSIELEYNPLLQRLNMADNNLYTINLSGVNAAYNKQRLSDINLSGNHLSAFEVPDNRTLVHVDISDNEIGEVQLRDADYLETLDISGNKLQTLDVHYCLSLKELDASGNDLTELYMDPGTVLDRLNVADNAFTFPTLPVPAAVVAGGYTYAPQPAIGIPDRGPGADLSSQDVVIDGHSTVYRWYRADGTPCSEGTDYTISNGNTRFLNTSMGRVYCEMTNGAFPALTLRTTDIEAAEMPTNEIASFITPVGGEAVELSLAAVQGNPAIYFDWSGDGNLSQYILKDTYTRFSATTTEGARVKVYTYTPEERISVFSITGATMSEFDGSNLNDAICITLSDAGLPSSDKLKLPTADILRELTLEGNGFETVDLTAYPNLISLSLADNRLSDFDVTPFRNLQLVSVADNNLSSVTLDNPQLWFLALDGNRLQDIDLSKVPALEQLGLSNNLLAGIDLSAQKHLRALSLVGNRFNYATLPVRESSWVAYSFGKQADIRVNADDKTVDLSFTAQSQNGTPTSFAWYTERPVENEYGLLDGEPLVIGEDYTEADGVTVFLGNYPEVVCAMTNADFEGMYLYTTPIGMGDGVEGITADDITVKVENGTVTVASAMEMKVALYSINGMLVGTRDVKGGEARFGNLTLGVYVLVTPAGPYRLIVK